MIASPVHSGEVDVRFCHSLTQSMKLCVQRGIDLTDYYIIGQALLHVARNAIVAEALRTGVDDLIFADADQDWQPEWIPELLGYPVDCVGAPVRKKTDAEERYNVKAPGAYAFRKHPTADLWTADGMGLGTGFIRYSRRALQVLWDNSEPYTYGTDHAENRLIFDSGLVDVGKPLKEMMGEDTMVNVKLREHGIETWLAPYMNPGHTGPKRWQGDFVPWIEALKREKAA